MKKSTINKFNNIPLILTMISAYIIYLIFALQATSLHTSGDELGTIASAAKLAGLDWSEALQNSGYYGFGYYWIFFILFKLNLQSSFIYVFMMAVNGLVRVMIIPIAYYVMAHYMEIEKEFYRVVISFISAFLALDVVGISNEPILNLMVWCVLLTVFKLVEHKENSQKRNKYGILLCFLLLYGLIIHTRWLTIVIAVAMVVVLYCLVYKVKLINWKWIVLAGIIYGVIKWGVQAYQNLLWSTENLANTSVSVSSTIDFFAIDTWRLWIRMVIGAITTMAMNTAGIFIVTLVTAIGFLLACIKNKRLKEKDIYPMITILIMGLCIGATIGAFMVSGWFSGMYETFALGESGQNIYAYKALTYIRYWEIYVSPLMVVCLSLLCRENKWKLYTWISAVILFLLSGYFVMKVLPWIENCSSALTSVLGISLHGSGVTDNVRTMFLIAVGMMLVAFVLIIICITLNKPQLALGILTVFLLANFVLVKVNFDQPVREQMYELIDETMVIIDVLEENQVEIQNIYVIDDTDDKGWRKTSILQFHQYRKNVSEQLPEYYEENYLLISNKEMDMEQLVDQEYYQVQLDEYEYICVFSIELYEIIKEYVEVK